MSSNSILISPSLLASDFSQAELALEQVSESGCDYVHLDVMDGHFVPVITFGPKFIEDIRKNSDLIFDTHLMIDEPERQIEAFAKAGSNIITIHPEATKHPWRCLQLIKSFSIECGLAINPGTSVSSIESMLDIVDYILVMSVNPGWGGQKFIPEMLKKIEELDIRRKTEGYGYRISVDGGVGESNIKQVCQAGADIAVMGTAFFREDDKKGFVDNINNIVSEE